jgi:hypothetical protein
VTDLHRRHAQGCDEDHPGVAAVYDPMNVLAIGLYSFLVQRALAIDHKTVERTTWCAVNRPDIVAIDADPVDGGSAMLVAKTV